MMPTYGEVDDLNTIINIQYAEVASSEVSFSSVCCTAAVALLLYLKIKRH